MDVIVDLVLDLNLFDCPSHEPDTEKNADMIDHIWGHTRIKVLDGATVQSPLLWFTLA